MAESPVTNSGGVGSPMEEGMSAKMNPVTRMVAKCQVEDIPFLSLDLFLTHL